MATFDTTAAERFTATLTIMGACGYLKTLPHAWLVYDPRDGVLYAVLDQYFYSEAYNNTVVSGDWRRILAYAAAAGVSGDDIGWPEDTGDVFPGVELNAAQTISWRIETTRAPWRCQEGERWFAPMSMEVIEYAINTGDPLWRALLAELELNGL